MSWIFVIIVAAYVDAEIKRTGQADMPDKDIELHLTEKYGLDFLDSLGHRIMIADSKREMFFANRAAAESFGGMGNIRGKTCYSIIRGTDRPEGICEGCCAGAATACCPPSAGRQEGTPENIKVYPLGNTAADARHLLFVFPSAESSSESVPGLVESQKLYVRSIMHDLNNMLMCIRLNTELAKSGSVGIGNLDELHDNCMNASRKSTHLIGNLATFLKDGDAGILDRRMFEPVNVREVVGDSARLFIKDSTVHFISIPGQGDCFAIGDRLQISQLFSNLLINAMESLHGDNGAITADVSGIELGSDNRHALSPGAYVRVAITDNGRGIEKEDLKHVFDPYFTTKKTGTGLGLSICSGIVKKHGGSISVESIPGEGTVFTVLLPAL